MAGSSTRIGNRQSHHFARAAVWPGMLDYLARTGRPSIAMRNQPATLTIRGRRWRLVRRRLKNQGIDGLCDSPAEPDREILVDATLTGERELDVFVHEMLHAAFWDLDEAAIADTATDIARALWRLGYRRPE